MKSKPIMAPGQLDEGAHMAHDEPNHETTRDRYISGGTGTKSDPLIITTIIYVTETVGSNEYDGFVSAIDSINNHPARKGADGKWYRYNIVKKIGTL